MAQTPIASSSLVFKTRQFYIEGTDPNTAKGDTLTFEDLDKTLLSLSQSIGTGGSGIYESDFDPATVVPDTVGGITQNTTVSQLNGKTFSEMFDELLFPTIPPTAYPGGASTSLTATAGSGGSGTIREVGANVNVTLTTTFTQGYWRAGTLVSTDRDYFGSAQSYTFISGSTTIVQPGTSYIFSSHIITPGANSFSSYVTYDSGQQPVDSKGVNSGSPISAGSTAQETDTLTGIYPYFYGSSSAATLSVADVIQEIEDLYTNNPTKATKVVSSSTNTITGYFYQSSPLICWFAHPASSQTKTSFYQNVSNTNNIGPVGTFNNNGTGNVSASGYWNNIEYRIYITNAATVFIDPPQFTVELRN